MAAVWVLLGTRHGDNQQLLAIAGALGVPFRTIGLRFNPAAGLPPVLLGASRLAWQTRDGVPLAGPWPEVVLASGRKSVSAARWIRSQSAGMARLVHLNRPWAPLAWFDLVVTTPQYALPARANVQVNRLPFQPQPAPSGVELPESLRQRAAALPRPWTTVMVGGDSRPYVLDARAGSRLADQVNRQVREHGGSAWVLGSPRTPAEAMDAIERGLDVSSCVVRWGQGDNPYAALRGMSDRFIVTTDSASMVTEVLLSGRPVMPFDLEARPDWRWRLATGWRLAAARAPGSLVARSFEALMDWGWLSSVRDVGLLRQALESAGAFQVAGRALELADQDRQATLARIAALVDQAR